ncbi:glycosyltransferase family 2 protein [Haliea sp. E17]|uniref:glycosyltransferase family 2 protein n=1 Tax=Haliea sp. E17 TaxID=3401576 RepID=UPI003AAD6FC2
MNLASLGRPNGVARVSPLGCNGTSRDILPDMYVGIITYNPKVDRLRDLCLRLSGENITVFVIDNGSENAVDISSALGAQSGIQVILNEDNLGIAAGINQLVEVARQAGVRVVMPVDQDSRFDDNYASAMLAHFARLRQQLPKLAALGGKVFDTRKRSYQRFVQFGGSMGNRIKGIANMDYPFVHADFLITSGTVVSVESIDQVGPMREELFIDSVDLEWSFRAKDRGWSLVGCEDIHLYQEVGVDAIRVPLLNINVRVHDPLRYYYMTRNRLFLYRQSYVSRNWVLRDFSRALLKFAFLSVASPLRKQIIREHARGMFDSFKL